MTLSAASLEKIDKEIAKYPADQKQSAVMSALAIAQARHDLEQPAHGGAHGCLTRR